MNDKRINNTGVIMDLSAKINLKQTVKPALTRQLVQSIELLQLSNVELAEQISSELMENPVLEEENTLVLQASSEAEGELLSTVDKELSGDEPADTIKEAWDAEYDEKSTPYDSYDDDRKRSFIENAVTQKETLTEHLINQAGLIAKDESELLLLETIITSLDDNGFLIVSPEEIVEYGPFELNKIKEALAVINQLDPIGCGARNVNESLVIQAMQVYPEDEILLQILKDYFRELEKLDYAKIASALHITTAEVIRKSKIVHNLDPFPGIKYSSKKTRYIIPDIDVKFLDGEIIISINDDWIPKIKINSYYKNILKQKPADEKLIEYIKTKIQSANNLLASISNRKTTIARVVGAIMNHQREFLKNGAGHLKPLVYADIAGELGLHESTISRTANNKFVQTPWGVFELKYFFVSKLKSGNNSEHSSDEVMSLIKEIVAGENPNNPASDLELLKILKDKGINVARRTIAKYRSNLNIAPSNMRKKLNFMKE